MIRKDRNGPILVLFSAIATVVAACGPVQPAPSTPASGASASAPPKSAAQPTQAPAQAAASTPAVAGAPTISISGPLEGEAKSLNGAGATFPAALYSKWFNDYDKLTQVKINYQSIGSGGGIKSIQDQTVDFGASDSPMTDEQLQSTRGGEILHIPTALGAVVPTYNVSGIKPDTKLKFSGETLAGIFLGDITR